MASSTVGQHQITTFITPVNGTTPIDANTVRGNDNTIKTAYDAHDVDGTIHFQDSTLAARPAASTAGLKWLTNDDYRVYYDDGAAWHEIAYLGTAGGTVAGNVVITGTLRVTGVITATAGVSTSANIAFTGNTSFVAGSILKSAANGLLLGAATGSSFDFTVTSPSGATNIIAIPTGTNNVTFAGVVTASSGFVAAGGSNVAGSITKSASGGLLLQGVTGSIADFDILTPGGSTIMYIPTGTSNLLSNGTFTGTRFIASADISTAVAKGVFSDGVALDSHDLAVANMLGSVTSVSNALTGSSYSALNGSILQTAATSGSSYAQHLFAGATHTSGTVAQLFGSSSVVCADGSGGTTTSLNSYSSNAVIATGATVTTLRGYQVLAPTNSGTIGTLVGLDVGNMTAGSTNFAIRTGTGPVSFGDTVSCAGAILSTATNQGVGYTVGAGASVTQITSKSTGVTLSRVTGQIQTSNATLNANTAVRFTVTNATVQATDAIVLTVGSAGTPSAYALQATNLSAGASFDIVIFNISASNLSEALVINFAIMRGASS